MKVTSKISLLQSEPYLEDLEKIEEILIREYPNKIRILIDNLELDSFMEVPKNILSSKQSVINCGDSQIIISIGGDDPCIKYEDKSPTLRGIAEEIKDIINSRCPRLRISVSKFTGYFCSIILLLALILAIGFSGDYVENFRTQIVIVVVLSIFGIFLGLWSSSYSVISFIKRDMKKSWWSSHKDSIITNVITNVSSHIIAVAIGLIVGYLLGEKV